MDKVTGYTLASTARIVPVRKSSAIPRDKAVNRGDKRTRRVRDRVFVKFERSRRYRDRDRYRDRYRCQEKKSRCG